MSHESQSMKTEVDRLSDLPDHLIHQIMSFLSPHEAAGFCLLSKQLSSAWLSIPDLNLDSTDSYWCANDNAFMDFAGNALRRRRLTPDATLRNLNFNFYLYAPNKRRVQELAARVIDEASELAVGQRVVDFSLSFGCRSNYAFPVPPRIRNQILQPFPVAVFSSRWIKSMVLSGLRFSSQELVVECPLLEDFRLECCYGATEVRFSGAAKLVKRVSISCCEWLETVRVSGPASLREFSYEGHRSFFDEDLCRIDFDAAACESLRLLDISYSGTVTGEWLRDKARKLVSLEKLVLRYCWELESVRIDNERLKHFELEATSSLVDVHMAVAGLESFMFHSGWSPPDMLRPTIDIKRCVRLRKLKMVGGTAQRGWMEANVITNRFLEDLTLRSCRLNPSSLPSSPLVLCRNLKNVELCLTTLFDRDDHNNNNEVDEDHRLIQLRDFLYLFGHCNTMLISLRYSKDYVYGENLKKMLSPALYDVKNLKLKVSPAHATDATMVELVDTFLWLTPRLDTLHILGYSPQPIFVIKFFYAPDHGESDSTCCSNAPKKCWRHDLTKVVIENSFDNDDDLKNLQIYFVKNVVNARVTLVGRIYARQLEGFTSLMEKKRGGK